MITLDSPRYLIQRYGAQLPPMQCSIQPSANSDTEPAGRATMMWEGPGVGDLTGTGATELELDLGAFESEEVGIYTCSAVNIRGSGVAVVAYVYGQ